MMDVRCLRGFHDFLEVNAITSFYRQCTRAGCPKTEILDNGDWKECPTQKI